MTLAAGPTCAADHSVPVPATLAPAAPFPAVLAQHAAVEFVAPGVARAEYHLTTSAGPLVVHAVALDPHEPTLRLGTVLAGDHLVSGGETIGSMARRTGAVAGVNTDYFDIGNTNQPVGIVVRDGTLVRTPSRRIAFAYSMTHDVRFERFTWNGSASYGATSVAVTAVNEWPPQGGASILTPAFGRLSATPGLRLIELAPRAGAIAGTFTVTALGDAAVARERTPFALAFGPALAATALPAVGDQIVVAATLAPGGSGLLAANGGGALVLENGAAVVDAVAPRLANPALRTPLTGAVRRADGTLFWLAIDGRFPAVSIGISRAEFGLLAQAFGGTDAMTFDSGGSASLVARVLGDSEASLLNLPSDGAERPVSDGMFAYSDAPAGPAARLTIRPAATLALEGAQVDFGFAVTDASGRPVPAPETPLALQSDPRTLAHLDGRAVVAAKAPASGTLAFSLGTLRASVPLRVVDRIARLAIEPAFPNPDPGATVPLHATGYDALGNLVAVAGRTRWSASAGRVDASGRYTAASGDGLVTAEAGGATATLRVAVGRHSVPLDAFGKNRRWTLATLPPAGAGAVEQGECEACLRLAYDFSTGGAAVYASSDVAVPGRPLQFSVAVKGDGSGAGLRAEFVDGEGAKFALTLARTVDWFGWRSIAIAVPPHPGPVHLLRLYAVPSLSPAGKHARGAVEFRDAGAQLTGSAPSASQ